MHFSLNMWSKSILRRQQSKREENLFATVRFKQQQTMQFIYANVFFKQKEYGNKRMKSDSD